MLSTVSPSTIESLAATAAVRGVHVVDTPVAGRGMFSVEEGTMSVMVGDDGELVTRLEPTLRRFASKVVAAGRLGSGAALKLSHNIVVYAGLAAMMEAVELARAAGVRDGLVEEVAQASGALSELSAFTLPFYKHFRDDPHGAAEDEIRESRRRCSRRIWPVRLLWQPCTMLTCQLRVCSLTSAMRSSRWVADEAVADSATCDPRSDPDCSGLGGRGADGEGKRAPSSFGSIILSGVDSAETGALPSAPFAGPGHRGAGDQADHGTVRREGRAHHGRGVGDRPGDPVPCLRRPRQGRQDPPRRGRTVNNLQHDSGRVHGLCPRGRR